MKIFVKIALLSLVATLMAACCACRSNKQKNRQPLVGTEWQLVQLDGRTMQPADDTFTITFLPKENRLAGVGACNRLTGTYAATESQKLRIESLASTRMMCPDMEAERKFIETLEATTHYDMDGPMLLLLSNGELRAIFQAKAK